MRFLPMFYHLPFWFVGEKKKQENKEWRVGEGRKWGVMVESNFIVFNEVRDLVGVKKKNIYDKSIMFCTNLLLFHIAGKQA